MRRALTSRAAHGAVCAAVAVCMLAPAASTAPLASARYKVKSVTITYAGTAKEKGVLLPGAITGGAMTETLSARLTGTGTRGFASSLNGPSQANQYLCSPNCPTYVVSGSVSVNQTFTSSTGKTTTCKRAAKVHNNGVQGEISVTSGKTKRQLLMTVSMPLSGEDLYRAGRTPSCSLPQYYPFESPDSNNLPAASLATAVLRQRTITVVQKAKLGVASPATGSTTFKITAVLVRKS